MGKRGRPSVYTQDVADEICLRMAEGESLRAICRTPGMPLASTVRKWVVQDMQGFFQQYARAREAQAHALAEELLEIADNGSNDWMQRNDPNNPGYLENGEHLQRSRLRVDARKWLTSKILPKSYGDKTEVEAYGKDGAPLLPPALHVVITREPGGDDQD
jgi:hypothetical protein